MKNQELIHQLADEIRAATPDRLDALLRACEEQKGKGIHMTQTAIKPVSRRKKWAVGLCAAAAGLVLCIGAGTLGYAGYSHFSVDSIIDLDVNPSIELKTNRNDRVLQVTALNDDAGDILDGMDLKGVDFDVAVNALIGSMLKNGYIDELKNSVLITVDNDDEAKSREMEARLMESISAILTENQIQPAIMSQSVSGTDSTLQQLADQYQISVGRASLIQRICDRDQTKTFDELAKLSVNDLYLIADSKDVEFDDILAQGDPSSEGYIDAASAKTAALSHAGFAEDEVIALTAKLDFDDGRMVYEVEFYRDGMEYDYEVDATTGSVLKWEKDRDDDWQIRQHAAGNGNNGSSGNGNNGSSGNGSAGNGNNGSSSGNGGTGNGNGGASQNGAGSTDLITAEEAKAAAFAHAGVTGADWIELELDWDDRVYEIEFMAGGYEYEYEICARSGRVLEADREWDD